MSRTAFAPQFLRDFQALETTMSDADAAIVDDMLASVTAKPQRPDRFQAYYDPVRPSWLLRVDPFLLHYAYDDEQDEVIFLNLFRRR